MKSLVAAVERDDLDVELADHVELCEACASILASLREESEGLTISVGDLWVRERISCPHRDILSAYLERGLGELEMDYIRFHLEVVDCPFCQAELGELEDPDARRAERLARVMDDSLRRSAAVIGEIKRR
ncbi:MAG: hypothetical protein H6807_10880 [Planctomycetes bacterium]|nr:hypothetical protein [Planctomycetota bacterium]